MHLELFPVARNINVAASLRRAEMGFLELVASFFILGVIISRISLNVSRSILR